MSDNAPFERPTTIGEALGMELRRRHDDNRAERRLWRLGLVVASLLHGAVLTVPVPTAAASDEPVSVSRRPPLVYRLQSVKFKLPSAERFRMGPIAPVCKIPRVPTKPSNGTGVSPKEPGFSDWHPGVARAGSDVPVPELLVRVDPVYPEPARRARLQGVVVIELLIDLEGRVADATVLRGLPTGLTQAALDALHQWRFAPSTIDGRPVPVRYVISIHFQLR